MEKIFCVVISVIGLLLVANPGRDAPKRTTKMVPNYAIEVTDDALEELRRQIKTLPEDPTDIRRR